MPPLTGILMRNADYYHMEWLPDGYPGRRKGEELWAHPIYGSYALKDYLEQFEKRPSEELRRGLRAVANAAVSRMEQHEGALVFWYEEDGSNSRAVERHYSGLTQGYYAVYLARAAHVLADEALKEVSERVFASLAVPVEKGGVLSCGLAGPSIAEVSQRPNSHILNGWQSALAAILEYAEVTGQPQASQLAHDSAQEMARLLPLYDAPAVANSRYGLTGFVYARLVFRGPDPSSTGLRNTQLVIAGESSLAVDRVGGRRWQNHVLAQDVQGGDPGALRPVGNVVRLNLVLSRISYPVPNRLITEVTGAGGLVEVQLQRGRYDPLTVSQADRTWVTVARVDCAAGTSRIDVPLPWDTAELVAYPTNFAKKIDDKNTNVYHVVHINRLRELASTTGIRELGEWADTWLRYLGEWRGMAVYNGLFVRGGKGIIPVAEAGRALPPSSAQVTDPDPIR